MNELSDHKSIGENLAPEEEQRLVDLGALGWPPEDIARSINANVEQFTQEYNDPNSRVAVLICPWSLAETRTTRNKAHG